MADLNTNVRWISGIGEARSKSLNKLGIYTLSDLVSYFPRAYDDRRRFKQIKDLHPGESVCVAATVAFPPTLSHIRAGMDIVKLRAVDSAGSLNITFFNQSYMKNALIQGENYIFYGKISGTAKNPEMTNPIVEKNDGKGRSTGRIVPIYRLTSGITQNMVSRAVLQGLAACGDILPDPLPRGIQQQYKLAQSRFSYENIHFPNSPADLEIARRRLIFEELFVLSCALTFLKRNKKVKAGTAIIPADMGEFYSSLPFSLTGAQKRAIDEALLDMAKPIPMSRLVQGDVGSGKTVVAAACCYNAFKSNLQSAFMAPTEILSMQHYETLSSMLSPLGIKVDLLKGSMKVREKRAVLEKLESGETDVLVGTHAIISENVKFKNLSLVITDEQHRFGVNQRAALTAKGISPHVMVMSATPIPRTLALMIYGDLDISIINELPPGRQKVDTFAVSEKMRSRVNAFIRRLVGEGRQVYIVCPMVEDNETFSENMKAVKEYADNLQNIIFPDLKVGLIHGKLRPAQKEKTMAEFAAGNIDILVATTVIEVGVDVPNAALIVVENADRFGLSQLHQLRGRVGRGSHKSYCILFESSGAETAAKRLEVMCSTNDGFKISEEDLKLRGPGDFFGSRQHGLPEMKIANFASDINLLKLAQEAAQKTLSADPNLSKPENAMLKEHIKKMLEYNADTLN